MKNNKYFFLLVSLVFIWGLNWPITKLILFSVPPIWSAVIRSAMAALALLIIQLSLKNFIIPKKHDLPAIIVIGLFHMTIFGAFMAIGLEYVSVGRSAVLAYTTPLWVIPGAIFILHEPIKPLRIIGVALGIIGIIILFNPLAMNWNNTNELIGNGLLLLAAISWAITILFIKAHKWHSTPFQLVFWQNSLAAIVLCIVALSIEGIPEIVVTPTLLWQLTYSGLLATALGFWMMTVINKELPAILTSLVLLAVPVIGIISSQLILGEEISLTLIIAGSLILCGVILGTINEKSVVKKT